MAKNRFVVMNRVNTANRALGMLGIKPTLWYDQKTGKIDLKINGRQKGLNLTRCGEKVGNKLESVGLADDKQGLMLAQLARWCRDKNRYPLASWEKWIGREHPAITELGKSDYEQSWRVKCVLCGSTEVSRWHSGRDEQKTGPACKNGQCIKTPTVESQVALPRIGYGLARRPSQCPTSSQTCERQLSATDDGSLDRVQDAHASSAPWD